MRNADSIRSRVSSQRSMKPWWCTFGLLSSLLTGASGQDICACSPSTYDFVFDFNLFCPPVNITVGDGVQETSCSVTPFDDPNVIDLIPVSVQSIDILELGQDLSAIVQKNIVGSFVNGDSFRYEANLPDQMTSPNDIPRAIQININGLNVNDDAIINVAIITFTNDCGTYPVLFHGQSIGWYFFRDLGRAYGELCPIAATPAPSGAPTVATESPSAVPSAVPTVAPTMAIEPPVVPPTVAPAMATEPPVVPTVAPASMATEPPVVPTVAPAMETVPPGVPTLLPSMAPSDGMMSMSMEFDLDDMMEFDLDDMMDDEFGRKKSKRSEKMPKLKNPKSSTSGEK